MEEKQLLAQLRQRRVCEGREARGIVNNNHLASH
jgi:hypothetical protein